MRDLAERIWTDAQSGVRSFLRGGPEEVLTAQRAKIGKVLAELDQHLSMHKYMMGDHFTVVDAYAFTVTNWCDRVKSDLQPYAHSGRS
jgi:glutathione S-transferase